MTRTSAPGYEDTAADVQRLWLDGRRDDATTRVPDEMVLATNLLGTDGWSGTESVRTATPASPTLRSIRQGRRLPERLETLGRVVDLVKAVGAEPAAKPSARV